MDRRQKKTRVAIFDSFTVLLSKKQYSKITIQEVIDEANVGRSTFYAYFSTKEDYMDAIQAILLQAPYFAIFFSIYRRMTETF